MFDLESIFAARRQQQQPMTTPQGYYQGQTQVMPAVATGRADNPNIQGIQMVPAGTGGTAPVAAGQYGGQGQPIPEGATTAPAAGSALSGMGSNMILSGVTQVGNGYAAKQLAEGQAQQKAVEDLPAAYAPILAQYQAVPQLQQSRLMAG